MHTSSMTKREMITTQLWRVGSTVVARETDFDITEGKKYEVIGRGIFYDCLIIVNDAGKNEEYSQDYFELLVE
jgi:hypothetical protein